VVKELLVTKVAVQNMRVKELASSNQPTIEPRLKVLPKLEGAVLTYTLIRCRYPLDIHPTTPPFSVELYAFIL
jgi:hypothetical protein